MSKKATPRKKPITLAPLSFEDAVRGLLAVKPMPKKKPAKKRRAKK
jgi:hypothetical protein